MIPISMTDWEGGVKGGISLHRWGGALLQAGVRFLRFVVAMNESIFQLVN